MRVGRTNRFGVVEALGGLAAGFILASVAVSLVASASHRTSNPSHFASDVTSLLGLWAGLLGAVILASWLADRAPKGLFARLRDDYGFTLRPWPDIPLGIAAGLGAQYLLEPLLTLPLAPFVPDLSTRLGAPARRLTAGVGPGGLVALGLLVCVGTPLVEELFFRGLFLRGLAGRLARIPPLSGRLLAPLSVLVTSVLFGLVHFEALQLLGLVGFGVVVGTLAWRTGRLGPGIVAHLSFNAATFVSLAALRPRL